MRLDLEHCFENIPCSVYAQGKKKVCKLKYSIVSIQSTSRHLSKLLVNQLQSKVSFKVGKEGSEATCSFNFVFLSWWNDQAHLLQSLLYYVGVLTQTGVTQSQILTHSLQFLNMVEFNFQVEQT